MSVKRKIRLFILKCKIARNIIFKYKYFIILQPTEQQVHDIIMENEFYGDMSFSYISMQEFHAKTLIKQTGEKIEDVDLIINKATFDAAFVESLTNKTKKQ